MLDKARSISEGDSVMEKIVFLFSLIFALSAQAQIFNPCDVDLVQFSAAKYSDHVGKWIDTTEASLTRLKDAGIVPQKGAQIQVDAYYNMVLKDGAPVTTSGWLTVTYFGHRWSEGLGGLVTSLSGKVFELLPEHNCKRDTKITFSKLPQRKNEAKDFENICMFEDHRKFLSLLEAERDMRDLEFHGRWEYLSFKTASGSEVGFRVPNQGSGGCRANVSSYFTSYDQFHVFENADTNRYEIYDKNWNRLGNWDSNRRSEIKRRFKLGTTSYTCLKADCYEVEFQ